MPDTQQSASFARISRALLSGVNRPIRLRLASEGGIDEDQLIVKHVDGVETLCGGIEYRLLCVSLDAKLPLKGFNALPAELQFVTDSGGLRSVCGIVAQAIAGESDGGLATRAYPSREEEADGDGWQARARREEAAWRAMQRRATQHPLVRRASSDSGLLG